ncbi:unnamed protein product [Linum trigynum]|uniref:Uncharacterized protein n=1 Tax=Linum trigynum TaxID=586398 RepID=A0AAV2EQ42_9ROSI
MKASSSSAGGGGSGESSPESSRLAALPIAAGAGAAGPPAYAEIRPAPSRCEPGSPPAGSSSDQDAHHKQPFGSGTGMVSQILLMELELMVEELLILETQLLELVSEVVLAGESETATPVLEGGGTGGTNVIHILGVDILISRILMNLQLVLRWDLRLRKPLDPLDSSLFSKQVHARYRIFAKDIGVPLLCAAL